MNETIAHRRFVDNAMLWVEHMKLMIRTVVIRAVHQFLVEQKNIVFKVTLER